MSHGVFARADGSYALDLAAQERELLANLAGELEQLVAADDDAVNRLFPAAYKDDPAAETEYRRLVGDSLVSGRLDALRLLRATVGSTHLDQEQAEIWCGALNDLRLVLGERLGVTEELYEHGIDPSHPNALELSVYGWLTWVQASFVDALASRL